MFRFEFEAIGTHWQIDIFDELQPFQELDLQQKIHKRIEDFDLTYSRFRSDSLVTQMSKSAGTYSLPQDSQKLFSLYKRLYDLTEGSFTPLIGQVMSDAGYDAEYSLESKPLTQPEPWEHVIELRENGVVHLRKPALLDFGAAGKGYLIDIVGELLKGEGVFSFCIDAGGDILYKRSNSEPIQVGLENPSDTQQVIGILTLLNQSVCGSAGNRRKWGNFHHMINPFTLTSPTNILASWIVADEAILADGLATAVYFKQPKILLESFSFKYLLLFSDFSIEKSADFPAEFFYNG